MTRFARALAVSSLSAFFALVLGSPAADAATHCHCTHNITHHHVRHSVRHHTVVAPVSNLRTAQQHLINLGYYNGRADGKLGPQTRKAIKNFQRDHGLKADGKLGQKTMRALADADARVIGTHSFKTDEFINSTLPAENVNSDYVSSMKDGTRKLNSRYASVDVNEGGTDGNKSYNVTVNGQTVLAVDGQPSVIGVSQTYDLGNEDVMIFTSYSPAEPNCLYHTHVLMLNNEGSKMADVDNCTRTYQARVDTGSLFITFPEFDANRAVGATYRVEGLNVERL
jgi:peptidoglycan hydrolase-like protein with peptidoglycan-binding domain